jgi:CheY-like chemotaxis protein
VVKPLGFGFEATPGYLGAAVLGDGGIVLILDSAFLVRGADVHSPAPATRASGGAAPSSPRILVVDDQRTARELHRTILTAAGYRVETARDGRDALEVLARRGPFDLVVTDLQMPAMSGSDLLRTIRDDVERSDLPVIVVTSNPEPETTAGGSRSGADAFIPKQEFDERALLATITNLIGRA